MSQPGKFEHTPLGKKMQNTTSVMPFVALTVMVLLRKNLGYRLVNPSWLFGVTLCETVASVIIPYGGRSDALFYFAWVTFGIGLYHRFTGWRKFSRGIPQLSFYIGDSRLRFSWMPEILQRNRRIERFVDPICVLILGFFLLPVFHLLGFWLAGAGACLRVFESDIYERDTNRALDTVDNLIVAEMQSKVVEKFEGAAAQAPQEFDPNVPTGMADDIQGHINRRKAKQSPSQKG